MRFGKQRTGAAFNTARYPSRQRHFLQPGTCKEGLPSRKLQRLNTGTKIQHHSAFIKAPVIPSPSRQQAEWKTWWTCDAGRRIQCDIWKREPSNFGLYFGFTVFFFFLDKINAMTKKKKKSWRGILLLNCICHQHKTDIKMMRAAAALTVFTDWGCTVWGFYDAKLQTSLNAPRRRLKVIN